MCGMKPLRSFYQCFNAKSVQCALLIFIKDISIKKISEQTTPSVMIFIFYNNKKYFQSRLIKDCHLKEKCCLH